MKIIIQLLCLCLIASGLHAAAPHPTILTVKYKDSLLPVVKVIGTDPVVLVDGKNKRLRNRCIFIPQRTESYGKGFVEFLSMSVATRPDAIANPYTNLAQNGIIALRAKLIAKSDMRGSFLLVCVSRLAKEPDDSILINSEFVVRELPLLEAGKTTELRFDIMHPGLVAQMDHFVQLFDAQGNEIPTNEMNSAWQYYATLEKVQLRNALINYRQKFAGQDHGAFPVVMPKPILSPEMKLPPDATATLTVSPDGYVTDVIPEGITDSKTTGAVIETLNGWLFLPQLKAGEPVTSTVQVPIHF